MSDTNMQDSPDKREERKAPPPPGYNRKDRRRLAKGAGLFKDRTGEAWKRSNQFMKGRVRAQEGKNDAH